MIIKDMAIIEAAAKQILSEILGYEEGEMYYSMLLKNDKKIKDSFSYSKRYRLLKKLYALGAVGKVKPEKQDFFNYALLPPTFLYFNKVDDSLIDFLEKLYLKNHSAILIIPFSQIIVKKEEYLLIFLLKFFMNDSASIITNNEKILKVLGKKINKINILVDKKDTKRNLGLIDKNIAYEFFNIKNTDSNEYIGYISNSKNSKYNPDFKNHYSSIEKELTKCASNYL